MTIVEKKKRFLLIVVVAIAIILPSMIWAQEEGLTLEGVAEQVAGLVERVEALESLYMRSVVSGDEGICQLAIGEVDWTDGDGGMHPTSLAAYLSLSDGAVPRSVSIRTVKFTPDGLIAIEFETYDEPGTGAFNEYGSYVIEYWNGCDFQSHSQFWEVDYSGNVTYLD